MSDMTDERAAEVLAAHNEWRRYNGDPFDPGAPEMGDPAEIGRALDYVVSRLRSQPPAEAQAVGEAGTMPGTDGGFTTAVFKAADVPVGTKLYTAPPSAPAPVARNG